MIDGYNNSAYTSKKRIIEERKEFLDSYWGRSLDDFTKRKLDLYDLITCISNSAEDKYFSFFKELCTHLLNLDVKEKNIEKKVSFLKEMYQIFEQSKLKENPFFEFCHQLEKTYKAINKNFYSDNPIFKPMFRLFDDLSAQKQKILMAGIRDSDNNGVLKEFPGLFPYSPPISLEKLEEPIITEAFYVPPTKKPQKNKNKSKKNEEFDIDVSQIQDLENSFKEFMEKYEGMIKTGREFWQMNVVEILRDLNTKKKDGEILVELVAKLYNEDFKKDKAAVLAQEAADFLIKNRKNIVLFCKIKNVFEKDEEDKSKNYKKDKQEFNKPSNFAVKINNNSNNIQNDYQMKFQDEDVFMVENYQILTKILV